MPMQLQNYIDICRGPGFPYMAFYHFLPAAGILSQSFTIHDTE
jgi:hypothetical protein